MALPLKPKYVPSAIKTLADTRDARLISQISARAFLCSRVSRDSNDHSLNAGGLHISYCKLFQDTHDKRPGETYSQADIIYRTMDDTMDSVRYPA